MEGQFKKALVGLEQGGKELEFAPASEADAWSCARSDNGIPKAIQKAVIQIHPTPTLRVGNSHETVKNGTLSH